jgi:AbrB family looped-hinge helix DNA binding protein
METTITSKGQITIPAKLRRKLGLKPGMKLEFDETAAFVKATKPVDLKRMRSVIGCLKDRLPEGSKAWIDEMRGPVELPPQSKKK